MRITRYTVRVMNPDLDQHLRNLGEPTYWTISAKDMQSAWRKFTCHYFGPELPDPSDYDISLHSVTAL